MNNHSYNGPLITILTDTKNRANLISRCIESIQKQTYQNYEHIIADGGSDNTEDVVKSYNDPRIKYIRVPQGGPVMQTKTAFAMSKGAYITFLDDDDEYLVDKLEKQLNFMLSLPEEYGFIYGAMSYYDNNTGEYLFEHNAQIEGGKEILPVAISDALVCGTPTFMFRREAFESIGGTWISNIGNERSDWALGCKALNCGWKVAALKESYLKIYINHNSVRLSNATFYKNNSERYIKFHNYFLREYADIIKVHPNSACIHYKSLIYHYLQCGNVSMAFKMWYKLVSSSPSLKAIAVFPYYLIKRICRHES